MSTEEMVRRCIKKDKAAWNEFIQRYQDIVRKAVYYKLYKTSPTAPRNDVDDIVQEVFLVLWKDGELAKLRDISRLKGWLVVVTINLVASYRQRQNKRDAVTISLSEQLFEDIIPCSGPDPAQAAEEKEELLCLEDRINQLKHKERRALKLAIYDGRKQYEIAKIMDIPANTAASLISRAKMKVQESVTEECYL